LRTHSIDHLVTTTSPFTQRQDLGTEYSIHVSHVLSVYHVCHCVGVSCCIKSVSCSSLKLGWKSIDSTPGIFC